MIARLMDDLVRLSFKKETLLAFAKLVLTFFFNSFLGARGCT